MSANAPAIEMGFLDPSSIIKFEPLYNLALGIGKMSLRFIQSRLNFVRIMPLRVLH